MKPHIITIAHGNFKAVKNLGVLALLPCADHSVYVSLLVVVYICSGGRIRQESDCLFIQMTEIRDGRKTLFFSVLHLYFF